MGYPVGAIWVVRSGGHSIITRWIRMLLVEGPTAG
jgi:hypothetical protein